jgi:hypothetical protein
MTTLSEGALQNFLNDLGGVPGLAALSLDTRHKMVSYKAEVVVISPDDYVLRLRLCQGGYRVYNERMEFVYSVLYDPLQLQEYIANGYDALLDYCYFGNHPTDALFVAQQPLGSIFYIHYNAVDRGKKTDRVVMVVISPARIDVQGTPGAMLQ